jgi:multidrug efflux system membrane fusion protein
MDTQQIRKQRSWLISAGIAIGIGAWLLSGQLGGEEPVETDVVATNDAAAVPQASVRVRHQVAEEVTRNIVVNGRTAPARIVQMKAETDGRVVAIGVGRGERFDKGQVIVRLDRRDRDARLKQAQATVAQRQLEFEARRQLKNESYVSGAQLQEAAAMLEAAKAELTRAQLDISYMTINAPFDGALQERHVEVGDFVKSGDPIATIVDDRTLIVSAAISEYDAPYVRKGGTGSAKLVTGATIDGTIRYVAPVADEATRTFTVELELDNEDGRLPAGTTAQLNIPAESVFAQKISPSLLTLDEDGNLGVKIVNEQGLVEFFPADVAMSSSEGVWIAGLPHTSTIITVGQGFVKDGAAVESITESDVEIAVASKSGAETE